MILDKTTFDTRHPSVRQVLPPETPTPVAGLDRVPHDLAALFVPLCGYQEVQARRLRAAVKIYEAAYRRHGRASFPLLVSGTNIEMRRCRETWDEMRQTRPWLPQLVTDGGYATNTQANGNAFKHMLHATVPQGSKVAIVTDAMHMNRVLTRVLKEVDGYSFVPFRAHHSHAERRAARAMALYEFEAFEKFFDKDPSKRLDFGSYLKALGARSGMPQRPKPHDHLVGRAPNTTCAVNARR